MACSEGKITLLAGSYTIHQSSQRFPIPIEVYPDVFKASNILAWGLWFSYFGYQLKWAYSTQLQYESIIWAMWATILAEFLMTWQEIVLFFGTLVSLFSVPRDKMLRPQYTLVGTSAPAVDILIPCCRESIDIIINTVAAALGQNYPSNRFHVFLLDDGRDENLQKAVEELNKKQALEKNPQATYLSREPSFPSHFKSGNLQYGIEQTKLTSNSEFLASLDADMIVEASWLRKMVPHLLLDDKLGLACPPQSYYNVPKDDPLCQKAEFDIMFTIYEPLNDLLGGAICTGSGFLVRRSALEGIGGWPLINAGEDFMCSSMLSAAGWKIAFIRENLQFGLAPDSWRSCIKQRMRWADSSILIVQKFNFFMSDSENPSSFTWNQRIVGLIYSLSAYVPLMFISALIILPIGISSQPRLLEAENDRYWSRRLFLASYIAHKVNYYLFYGHVGLKALTSIKHMAIWAAPYNAYRCMASLIPSSTLEFHSSGSILSHVNERSRNRKSLIHRLMSLDMLVYFMYTIYASTIFLKLCSIFESSGETSTHSFFPLPGALMKLLECLAGVMVPLRYMIFPPTMPENRDLVEDDGKGVLRPKMTGMVVSNRVAWTDVAEVLILYLCDWR